MTKAEWIKVLERYDDDVDIDFFVIPNDGSEEDGDEKDLHLKFVNEIYTGGIEESKYVELGFQIDGSRNC
jgi:hypothetical protein